MKTRWSLLRNEGILLWSSKLIISVVVTIIKYFSRSRRTQLHFRLQQCSVLFAAFSMKYHEYYITFITPSLKHGSACVGLLFLIIFTLEIIPTLASWQLSCNPSNVSWSAAWLSCGQSIHFLDEHGILRASTAWFLQTNCSPDFFCDIYLARGLCNNWVSY